MNNTIQTIPVFNLCLSFIPVVFVVVFMHRWSLVSLTAVYATLRMVIQLVLIGYVLTYIFRTELSAIVIAVLAVMLVASSWIALRPVKQRSRQMYLYIFTSITLGGVTTLALITQVVLELNPWYLPQYMIPLAGMIFANAMNTVSLAAERFESETKNGIAYEQARSTAFNAALIPLINMLFAVGLVSLPGMMTGQILSGVSPLIAVRYQIMVMCMVFGSGGISAACYLYLIKHSSERAVGNVI